VSAFELLELVAQPDKRQPFLSAVVVKDLDVDLELARVIRRPTDCAKASELVQAHLVTHLETRNTC
jgi:hypothetical protein